MASSAARGKIAEGQEYIRQAEKSLKTSLFKWKPDYDGAAMDYANAATCFKNAKQLQQCKDCLMKAAECHKSNMSLFSAAKSLEQAAMATKELGDLQEAVRLIERACKIFQEHGSPDTAALSLEKGAKMVEGKLPEMAASLYLKAADVVMLEDRPRQAAEYLGRAGRLQLKLQQYDEACNTTEREFQLHLEGENPQVAGRLSIVLILIHLTRGDTVAAQKAFQVGRDLLEAEECESMEMLIEAFDQEDGESAGRALSSPFIKHLDVEYAKLARKLANAGGSDGARKSSITSGSDSSLSSFSARAPPPPQSQPSLDDGGGPPPPLEEEEDDGLL